MGEELLLYNNNNEKLTWKNLQKQLQVSTKIDQLQQYVLYHPHL